MEVTSRIEIANPPGNKAEIMAGLDEAVGRIISKYPDAIPAAITLEMRLRGRAPIVTESDEVCM